MSNTQQAEAAQWLKFVERYRQDPVGFVKDVFRVSPDPWQCDLLNAISSGERRISVRSGHGVGKSTAAAWASVWFLMTRYPVKVVITAPTSAQLFDALYAEIKSWFQAMPIGLRDLFEVKSERVELVSSPSECFISVRTSRAEQPEALQGVHSKNVMLIADEASGVPEQVFEAASGSMSGHNAVTLLFGNPVRSSGFFYDTHQPESDWRKFHVSCIDSPRCSPDYIAEMRSRYGEDSNAFRIRVLGEFPLADDDTVIPMELIQMATMREITPSPMAPVIWGLDVARYGNDSSCLVKRKGSTVVEAPRVWRGFDTMQLVGAVVHEYEGTPEKNRPAEILVDVIGLGSGVADRLRELQLPAAGINVSEAPAMKGKYINLRSQLWDDAKTWFASRDCVIPRDERLIGELAMVRYSFNSSGKLQVESKDQIRKRGRKSPDVADAFVLTFASTASTAIHGRSPSSPWNKKLRRSIKGVS